MHHDKNYHKEHLKHHKEKVVLAKKAKQEMETIFKAAAEAVRVAKSAKSKVEKEFPPIDHQSQQRIEEHLEKECGVYLSSYHGGDMEGNQCHCFREFDVAERAMAIIKEEALKVESQAADELEIDQWTKGFKRLLQLAGMMSSQCYAPYKLLTDEDLDQAEDIINKYNDQWQEIFETVPPKVHMWDHLLEDLKRTGGLLFHQEGFIEIQHQEGK